MADQDTELGILHGLENHRAQKKEASIRAYSEEADRRFKKEKEEKAKERVKNRLAQRQGVYSFRQSQEPQQDNSFASKVGRISDLNPESLVGEFMVIFTFEVIAFFVQRQFWVQIRAYNEALELDQQKEHSILLNNASDDGVRLAYAPKRIFNKTTNQFEYEVDAKGNLVYPEVYNVDASGEVDYNSTPNTDGTASRAALRANGFVPIEDLRESLEIQMLLFRKEISGLGKITSDQQRMLNMHAEKALQHAQRDTAEDNLVLQQQRQAQMQQDAAKKVAARQSK
ncbi:MAG: hypothetical protein AB7V32_10715 [Candidatus Berkiella sp.]